MTSPYDLSDKGFADIRKRRAAPSQAEAKAAPAGDLARLVMHETGTDKDGNMPHEPREALLILRNAARAALAAHPAPQGAPTWPDYERICNVEPVDEALHVFTDDPTHDNAVCVVRAVLENAAALAAAPEASLPSPTSVLGDDARKCRDCADFGPICPNSGLPCGFPEQGQGEASPQPVAQEGEARAQLRHLVDDLTVEVPDPKWEGLTRRVIAPGMDLAFCNMVKAAARLLATPSSPQAETVPLAKVQDLINVAYERGRADAAPRAVERLTERITAYLAGGGLFNPELANHDAVRDLLIECRGALTATPPALPESSEPLMFNGLTEAETNATASVFGLVGASASPTACSVASIPNAEGEQ